MLLVTGTLFSGLLAGGNLDRLFVGMPAWSEMGAQAWAAFSQHADLKAGLILYPLEALLSAGLIPAATASYLLERRSRVTLTMALLLASISVIAGLVLTAEAAPVMLTLRRHPSAEELPRLFALFRFWGNL